MEPPKPTRVYPVSYPEESLVRDVLKPFEQVLMDVHFRAWKRLISNSEWPTLTFASTDSKMMHDIVVQEAALALDEMPGIYKIAHDKSVRYLVNDQVLFRFKKGGRDGLGSNIDTKANSDFIDAKIDLLNLPCVMKVEILWYSNKLMTKIDKVEVTARNGKSRLWGYALGQKPDIGMLPTPLPIQPVTPPVTLVALKPVHKTRENEDNK